MEGPAVLPPGSDAHAAAQRPVLPVPATLHRPLREPGRRVADGRESDELLERQCQP